MEMHCKQVKNKSGWVWECFSDGPRNPATGKRRLIKRRGSTKGEAKKRVELAISELKENRFIHDVNVTFDKLANKWLELYETTGVKRSTIRIRILEIKLANKYLAKVPVSEITHYMYQGMLTDLNDKGYARNSIIGVNASVNLVFKYAVKNRLIKSNPGQDIVIPKRTVTVDELESDELQSFYFERHELDLFLKEVINLGMRLDKEWFYTLAFSGMRPAEMIALKKQQSNFEDNTIRVSKTMYNEENTIKGYMLNTTKTNQMRTIGMSPKVMQMLKYLVRKNDVHKMKYRRQITDFHDADFVFQRKNGYPYTTQN